MIHGKFMVMLLVLMLPFLIFSQPVGGQGLVTETTTTVVSNSQPVTVTEQSLLVTNASQGQSIFSSPLTLPPTHGVCGTYFVQPFNGTSGSQLWVNVTATSKVDFYVMTDAVYQDWTHKIVAGGNCAPSTVLLIQKATTAYNATLNIPNNGLYQIVLNNLSASSVNAHLTANLSNMMPSTVTVTMYSTSTQPNVQTLTLITLQQQTTSQGSDNTTTILGVVIVVIIIAVALIARAKRGKK